MVLHQKKSQLNIFLYFCQDLTYDFLLGSAIFCYEYTNNTNQRMLLIASYSLIRIIRIFVDLKRKHSSKRRLGARKIP